MKSVQESPYDNIPYLTLPASETHPDRLASVAALFGIPPAPVTSCRVLEIGCGNGANLIPMAWSLPQSRFTGIDLAESAIAAGAAAITELNLRNLRLIAMDLREIGPAIGEFDYIVAHGVYSWVPENVRERLLEVCRERLAPAGVVFISYNALPGRYVRLMFREMMLRHTAGHRDPRDRLDRARELVQLIRESRMAPTAWAPMIEDETERLVNANTAWLFHDDLAPVNESFYLRDFVTAAARHGLQYLGDAEPHLMFDPRGLLDAFGGDAVERAQYLDFLSLRRFGQTLLCHAGTALQQSPTPEQMDSFLFAAPAEGLHGVRIPSAGESVARVAGALGEVYPLPVAFEELLEYEPDRNALREILFALIASGFAEFHLHDFPCEQSVAERPRASLLAQWESARSRFVTTSGHRALRLDDTDRSLVRMMDGTRGIVALAAAIGEEREQAAARVARLAGLGLLS